MTRRPAVNGDEIVPVAEGRAAEPFEDGARVLHIGPPKTGTSTIQAALHGARGRLAEHGVLYAGKQRHSREAATYAALGRLLPGYGEYSKAQWSAIVDEMRAATARLTVFSSESLSRADRASARRIVAQLGGEGVQVVVTVRPFAMMLGSMWQQRVRNGEVRDLESWLRDVFACDPSGERTARGFWGRASIDRLVRRWAAVVGAENVTVVVLDPADRSMLLRTFDRLLGLPDGSLTENDRLQNASMPLSEVEALRAFNLVFDDEVADRAEWVNAVRRTALKRLRDIDHGWFPPQPVAIPRWAADAANEVAREWVDYLRGFGGRVIGDLAVLESGLELFPERPAGPAGVPPDAVGRFAAVMYQAARDHHRGRSRHVRRAARREAEASAARDPAGPRSAAAGSEREAPTASGRRFLASRSHGS